MKKIIDNIDEATKGMITTADRVSIMDYSDPVQWGRNSYLLGVDRYDCWIDRRTHANHYLLWVKGWDEEYAKAKCKGFEIEAGTGDYTGCDQSGGDCPVCAH